MKCPRSRLTYGTWCYNLITSLDFKLVEHNMWRYVRYFFECSICFMSSDRGKFSLLTPPYGNSLFIRILEINKREAHGTHVIRKHWCDIKGLSWILKIQFATDKDIRHGVLPETRNSYKGLKRVLNSVRCLC